MKISALKGNRVVEYLLLSTILVLGIIFIFVVPPFQKADESAHFMRGVALSNGEVICEKNAKGDDYFNIPKKYFKYMEKVGVGRIHFNYNEKFFLNELKSSEEGYQSEEMTPLYGFCSLPFLAYIPTATSVRIGNLLNSISLSFYLARIMNFAIFFIALLWSYNKIRNSKLRWILIAYAMIPMVTHQASAIVYDALQLAIIPILFALNISFIEEKEIRKRDLWTYFISMFVLLTTKSGYYFMSLLYFLIPKEKISKDKKKYLLCTFLYFFLCIISLVVYIKVLSGSALTDFKSNVSPIEQFKYILGNPLSFLLVIKNTLGENLYFYIGSFIGHFGWLDYSISPVTYLLFFLSWVLLISQIKKGKNYNKLNSRTLILGLSIFLTIGFIFGSIYLTWNPVGNTSIVGIQGRYFLILFPFLMLFAIYFIKLFESKKLLRTILLFLFIFYVLFELSYVIYKRYYDYSYIKKESNYSMMV